MISNSRNWFRRTKGSQGAQTPAAGTPGTITTPLPSPPPAVVAAAAAQNSGETAPATPELTPAEQALYSTLVETVHEQCDFMMRAAPPGSEHTDGPTILKELRQLGETVIRQPPAAAQRALAAARDPVGNATQVAEIFAQDPALTRALLQAANSSFYHRGSESCLAIPEAIQWVGMRGVESIVTTNMVEGLLCRPGGAYNQLVSEVWSHMTRTAPIARVLAPAFGAAPETAFTVGLLHDMGKLIVFHYLSQLRASLRREVVVADRFMFNMLNWLHEPLGGIAALRWNLGLPAARAIAYHHQPADGPPDPLAELLCVSERTDHAIRLRAELDTQHIWRQIGLRTDVDNARLLLNQVPGVRLADDSTETRPRAA